MTVLTACAWVVNQQWQALEERVAPAASLLAVCGRMEVAREPGRQEYLGRPFEAEMAPWF